MPTFTAADRASTATVRPARSRLRLRLRSRTPEAEFEQLFREHHQEIYRYCLAIVRNDADAEDALQATMAAALRTLRDDDREIAIRPWLFRVAHNESISLLRRRREQPGGDELPELPSDSAADELASRERLRTLVDDLRTLPERQRSALVMRELSGLSYREIAAALTCAEGAARQVVHEARTGLYTLAEGREMECEQAREAIDGADRRRLRGRKLKAHLAACESCRDFKRVIDVRERDLRALCPPLPIVAAGGILSAVIGGSSGAGSGAAAAGAGGGVAAGASGAAGGAAGASGAGAAAGVGGSAVAGGLAGSAAVKGASLAAAAVIAAGAAADLSGAIELPGPLHIGGEQGTEQPAAVTTGDEQRADPDGTAPSAAGRPGAARAQEARQRGVEASTRKGANGKGKGKQPGNGGDGGPRGGQPPQAQGGPPQGQGTSPPGAGSPTPGQPPATAAPPAGVGGGNANPGAPAVPDHAPASPPSGGAAPGGAQGPPVELPGGRPGGVSD